MLLHNPHNILENISIFYSPLFNSGSRKKYWRGICPFPPAPSKLLLWIPTVGVPSVWCISEICDIQGEERSLCEHLPSI